MGPTSNSPCAACRVKLLRRHRTAPGAGYARHPSRTGESHTSRKRNAGASAASCASPARRPRDRASPPPRDPAAGAADRPVAIVDDDPSIRRALPRLLATLGLPSIAFASAEDFLAAGTPDRFRCLLLDVHLGGMSGPELSTRLAADGSPLPVIFLTASAEAETAAQLRGGAACARLWKPVDLELLRATLEAAPVRPTAPSPRGGRHPAGAPQADASRRQSRS